MARERRVPKSEWGDGPWQQEPDRLEWRDERTGLQCLILRAPTSGGLCGYVGVRPGHAFFGWSLTDDVPVRPEWLENREVGKDVGIIDTFIYALGGGSRHGTIPLGMALSAHGGVSWAGGAPDGSHSGLHFFGFDCSHAMDFAPAIYALLRELYAEKGEPYPLGGMEGTYRDLAYVQAEVTSLAFQLRQLEEAVPTDCTYGKNEPSGKP